MAQCQVNIKAITYTFPQPSAFGNYMGQDTARAELLFWLHLRKKYLKFNFCKELSNIKKDKNEFYMKDSAQDKITLWGIKPLEAQPG